MAKGTSKENIILDLKHNWLSLLPTDRKRIIYSLLGHRMNFMAIAKAISQPLEDVKLAYKGFSNFVPPCAEAEQKEDLPLEAVSPVVTAVSSIKSMYSYSFDEILQQYREFIGWENYPDEHGIGEGPNDPNYLNGIIISDIHAPFQDENAFANMIAQTRGKVDVCILAGDGPDFHNYSRFIKYGQHFTIQQEHKAFMAVLATLSEAYPEVIMIPGNHDERTRKRYAQSLPPDLYEALLQFHGNNTFDFAELMTKQFDNIIIPTTPTHGFAEYRFMYQCGDIVVGHPELFSKIANRSVGNFIDWLKKKAEPMGLVQPFSAVVMGHTHQAGKTFNDYGIIGIENSCLCMTPDYDAGPKLSGAPRPTSHGYTRFRTNKETGKTSPNDINLIYL